jgi:hypothetical protein
MAADTFIEKELLLESNYLVCVCDKCLSPMSIHAQKELKLANSTSDVTLVSGINCLLNLFREQNYTL